MMMRQIDSNSKLSDKSYSHPNIPKNGDFHKSSILIYTLENIWRRKSFEIMVAYINHSPSYLTLLKLICFLLSVNNYAISNIGEKLNFRKILGTLADNIICLTSKSTFNLTLYHWGESTNDDCKLSNCFDLSDKSSWSLNMTKNQYIKIWNLKYEDSNDRHFKTIRHLA